MFTGIVEELGDVVSLAHQADAVQLTVRGPLVVADARRGDSIAVNGCCLTVLDPTADCFSADVMQESLDKTSLRRLTVGSRVNLERAVTPGGRLGGHIVQGHVDGTGTITRREHSEHWDVVTIALPIALTRYVALKGSIAVDGVSLTVSGVADPVDEHIGDQACAARRAELTPASEPTFTVSLIPTTLGHTTLGFKQPGDLVNLEVDVVAKYLERLLGALSTSTKGHAPRIGHDGLGMKDQA
ncbi:MAG: riboflavin synthase [Nocardioidaceae bacterium]